ncbi:MAG: NAD-dependent epimerase/dehydratase family protein [Deltaproteobacteria bacterium]|nr:NAD-dependent epimerase/dehydratase family protein [Deltaproteobacteria bacterium]
MSERYLITGGAGFIGSHLVKRLVAEGGIVRVVDNLSTGHAERLDDVRNAIQFINGDLAEESIAEAVVKDIDYVLHQAAVPSVQRSIGDAVGTNQANVTATLNLLESCRKAGVHRLVYAASSSAYGDTEVLPKTEEMPADPLSPYALQKWVGERYCKLYYDLHGLETVSLRYFNVFGPDQDPYSEYSAVIPKFITNLLAKESVTVYGDGEQSRDFTYIDNVVNANLLALHAKDVPGKVCNIGCGERITLNKLIQMLEQILGVKAKVNYAAARAGDVRHSLADIQKARRLLGYNPQAGIEQGLRKTVKGFKGKLRY